VGETVKVGVVGAGAIGGMIAVKLALSGEDVSVIDRGAHLAAISLHADV
jgi:2-dehydropantoate 2-reductase